MDDAIDTDIGTQITNEVLALRDVFAPHHRRWISGICTSKRRNDNGVVIAPRGARLARPCALLWRHAPDRPVGVVESILACPRGLQFKAAVATGRLGWLTEVWQLITAGAALCVSVTVTNRYAGTNYFADYLLEEITICPRGANQDAVIDTVVEEYCSKTVRLEYDAAHPRRTRTVFVEYGHILEQPRHIVYT